MPNLWGAALEGRLLFFYGEKEEVSPLPEEVWKDALSGRTFLAGNTKFKGQLAGMCAICGEVPRGSLTGSQAWW